MKKLEDLIIRAGELVALAKEALAHKSTGEWGSHVRSADFTNVRSSALSFIEMVYGREHSHYREFDAKVADVGDYHMEYAVGILTAIQTELATGWLTTTGSLVSAEIFSDFLEMAGYLLTEGYKDAAAVMIGGVLEEHLRQLARKAGIKVEELKDGKPTPRKVESLNADLYTGGIYSKLDNKGVTAWLDLRNKAAHAKYSEYGHEQVAVMLTGVQDFLTRNPVS